MSQTKVQLIKDGALAEDSIVHDGDTNTKIRFSGTDTITAETAGSERFRIDSAGRLYTGGSTQVLDTTAGSLHLHGGTAGGRLAFRGTTTSASSGIAEIFSFWDTNKVAGMIARSGTDTTNKDDGDLGFYTNTGSGITERVRIETSGAALASKNFVSKKSNDASVATSTASGFTANSFNIVLGQDVLEAKSTYLITFFWDHQGSGQPFESYGSFTFQPGNTNPGSTGAMGPDHVPLQGAHTEQGVSKFWTFRYYSSTGAHVHGLQAACATNLNDANGNGQITVHAVKLADTTTI
tara:strand:+ start:314 stop:1195 length:882 start_codon:yes stop_codon:yes gene_type:complete